MEISYGDYRRIWLTVAAVAVLLGAVVGVGFFIRPKNSFEREHARAEAMNPKWVSVEITTADNRREYREGERIKVIARYYSTARYQYKIEVADGFSTTAATDVLHLSNGQLRMLHGDTSIVCCDSRLIGLDDQGYIPPTLTFLKLKPGEYELYLTSRRVFNWDVAEKEYHESSFQVASNLLKIRVVPNSR